jgi:hypothetical protein
MDPTPQTHETAAGDDPEAWFRPPTRREHAIAAGLFAGFGLFFLALFVVIEGWWFRWVIAALGVYSLLHAAGHGRDFVRSRRREG